MNIPLRADTLRSVDTEARPTPDARNAVDSTGFGEMFAELKQREIKTEDDRESPPPGTEAAFAGQTAPMPARPNTPEQESRADGKAESDSTGEIAGAGDAPAQTAETAAATTTAVTSAENFVALLESSTNSLSTTLAQLPSGDGLLTTGLAAVPQPAVATPAALPPPVTATIAPPLHSPAWSAAFNNTIRVLVTDQTQIARLQLTPGDLGPVDVRIAISDHRAEIAFAVSSPEAKAAIQQALPQLRESFAASGLQLGDATFGESPRGGSGEPANRGTGWQDGGRPSGDTPVALPAAQAVGLIDLYA